MILIPTHPHPSLDSVSGSHNPHRHLEKDLEYLHPAFLMILILRLILSSTEKDTETLHIRRLLFKSFCMALPSLYKYNI